MPSETEASEAMETVDAIWKSYSDSRNNLRALTDDQLLFEFHCESIGSFKDMVLRLEMSRRWALQQGGA